jgi:hypothetical protein
LYSFNASRRTPRCVLADNGRDGCDSLLKCEENEKDEVVGSVNGKGMMAKLDQTVIVAVIGERQLDGSATIEL